MKVMMNLDSILKSRDITLPSKVRLVKAMVFSSGHVRMWEMDYKAERGRSDASELWCWRRLLLFGREVMTNLRSVQFSSVQPLSRVQLFATPWITACQASLSITNSWCLLKLMSIESVMPSNHLILCHPFLLLPPIPPSIRVFSNESALHIRWPKY